MKVFDEIVGGADALQVILVRLVHPEKTALYNLVTVEGITMVWSDVQF